MLSAMVVATVLVLVTVVIHYEALRLISGAVPVLTAIPPRQRLIAVLIGVFAAHTVEVWVYGLSYWFLDRVHPIGSFGGEAPATIADYVYFSVVTYSSLGFGDVYPRGALRLLAGVEAVNGLLMIGWSASYTYIAMTELWGLHKELTERRRKHRAHRS